MRTSNKKISAISKIAAVVFLLMISAIGTFFCTGTAAAATIYANSSTGNDTTGDGTSGNPYKTFYKVYTTAVSGDTLNLTGTFTWTDADETGDAATTGYTIGKNLTISGNGPDVTIVQAASADNTADRRIFTIPLANTVTINSLSVRYGKVGSGQDGGGVYVDGMATINSTDVSYNRAPDGSGGGIDVRGSLTIQNSTIHHNVASYMGGGLNRDYYSGSGGIPSASDLLDIINCTISYNQVTQTVAYLEGGGVFFRRGQGSITNSTIAYNTIVNGGGTSTHGLGTGDTGAIVRLKNNIIAANTLTNCWSGEIGHRESGGGTYTDNGGNIIGKLGYYREGFTAAVTTWVDQVNDCVSPDGTYVLQNGGSTSGQLNLNSTLALNSSLYGTMTHAITSGTSIAVNNGTSGTNGTIAVPIADQRGLSRAGLTDIGAYEYGASSSVTLTVTKAGTGSGTVTATGINCGADCTEAYSSGTSVTLAGSADIGSTFAGWSSGTGSASSCSGTGDCTFSITADSGVTATFTLNDYTVTYNGNTNTGGSVPTDGNTYHITDTVTVLGNTGSLVKTGYTFAGWNTAANGSGTSYSGGDTFAMGSANVTLYAQWTMNTYTLTVTKAGTGTGIVTATGINCGADCNETYNYNTSVTLTAIADTGSTFAGWSGGTGSASSCSDTGSCSFNITATSGITATFTLSCSCIFVGTISPTGASYPAAGGSGTVRVTEAGCCWWGARSNASWITVTKGANGCGYEDVTYSVTENPGLARTGTITIAWQTFTVTQESGCSFTISPQSASHPASGGTGSVNVTASDSACSWTATNNASWITITSGSSGTGSGTVEYSVAENTGTAHSGTMTIAGNTFTVIQESGCTYSILPASASYTAPGGTGSISVTASDSACAWTATNNADWITITSGASGTGSGTVGYSASENSGPARSGTITIAGSTFTVSQEAGCTCSLTPTSSSYSSSGGTGSITVTASESACTWTAASNASWITITSGSSGTGSGMVGYTVEKNPEMSARTGEITIADQTHSITQEGKPITFEYVIYMYEEYVQGLCAWDEVIAAYLAYVAAQMGGM
jgi:uncharacterized repeat protein (TIGR02543 family)